MNYSERRGKPRIICNYPVIVECAFGGRKKHKENAKLLNLSATGLYVVMNSNINDGSPLSMTILLTDELGETDSPKILTNGIVTRTDYRLDGSYGIAVKFISYRFI
jgi:hypothetical protein